MRSLFVEDSVDMGRDIEILGPDAAAEIRDTVNGRYVCPFCGAVREQADGDCPRCTMESTATTRQATKARIGPWYVLQTRNPAAPGMKYETLLAFVAKGRVKARSIVRGPTTHQLWRFAAHVKGLSREFGVCYSCGESIARTASLCPHCNRPQDPPANPDIFLETGNPDRAGGAPAPVYREIGPIPMVAEDVGPRTESAPSKADPMTPNPIPKGPDPRTMKKGADGFLTAADLAAAFKLDIQHPKGRKQRKAAVAPIAMDRQSPVGGLPRRKRRWFRVVLLLLLAAAIGVGAYQYRHDSVFHARADHWYADGSTWTKMKWGQVQQAMNKASEQHAKPKPVQQQMPLVVMPVTTDPSQDPQPSQSTQPAVKPSPWDQLYNPATTHNSARPEHSVATEPQRTSESTAPTISIEPPPAHAPPSGGIDDVRALYGAAMDADAKGDYVTAVKKYEQIKEFSKDLWPRDLELRLKVAREQIH
jgi:rubrerythrin